MDENFDHELIVEDPQNVLYSLIVNRREHYTSFSRLMMQLTSFFSFVACVWLLLATRDVWWVVGLVAFFVLTMANPQVLNYRVILDGFRKEEQGDVDDIT